MLFCSEADSAPGFSALFEMVAAWLGGGARLASRFFFSLWTVDRPSALSVVTVPACRRVLRVNASMDLSEVNRGAGLFGEQPPFFKESKKDRAKNLEVCSNKVFLSGVFFSVLQRPGLKRAVVSSAGYHTAFFQAARSGASGIPSIQDRKWTTETLAVTATRNLRVRTKLQF